MAEAADQGITLRGLHAYHWKISKMRGIKVEQVRRVRKEPTLSSYIVAQISARSLLRPLLRVVGEAVHSGSNEQH